MCDEKEKLISQKLFCLPRWSWIQNLFFAYKERMFWLFSYFYIQLTWADLNLYACCENLTVCFPTVEEALSKHSKFWSLYCRVAEQPRIAEWIKNRPVTYVWHCHNSNICIKIHVFSPDNQINILGLFIHHNVNHLLL